MATAATGAGAVWSTLALAIVLCHGESRHSVVIETVLCLNDLNTVAVSLLHTLSLVSAVTVAAGVRHDE